VRAAAAVYGERQEMEAWAAEQECETCAVVRGQRTDTLALAAASRECGYVVFRGTRDLRNWMSDLDCRLRIADCGLGEVHDGFECALASVEEELDEVMERWSGGVKNVFFAGHSLGGALAMLAAARMAVTRRVSGGSPETTGGSPVLPWVYTFGQPRVGNGAWARWYDGVLRERSFRVVHADDVVPRVPWLLGVFRHAGHEVFFTGGNPPSLCFGATSRTDGTNGTDGTDGTCGMGGTGQAALVDASWVRKLPYDLLGLWRRHRIDLAALLADHRVSSYVRILNGEC